MLTIRTVGQERVTTIAVAVALMLSAMFSGSAAAVAPNGPCSGAYNTWIGQEVVPQNGPAGAEVRFDSISPLLCTTSAPIKGSLSWAGVAGNQNCEACIYQIGTAKCTNTVVPSSGCNGTFKLFYAWGRHPDYGGCAKVLPYPLSLGSAPTGVNTYQVVRTASQIQFKVNGVIMTTIGASNICWGSIAAQYFAETFNTGDQAGGTVGDRQNFTNALYEASVGGAWLSPSFTSCVVSPANVVYRCSRINGQAIDVWTDRS